MIKGKLFFKDRHIEECIMIRPHSKDYCEVITSSGLYVFDGYNIYKYYPDRIKIEPSLSGYYEFDDSDCYLIDSTVNKLVIELGNEVEI